MKAENLERRSSLNLPARRFAYPSQAVFFSHAALLEEVGPPKVPAIACFLGFILVCIAILTTVLVRIDVVSASTGRLISPAPNQGLQSFDGGIVEELHVEEGQVVDRGDLLLTLHDPEATAQLNRLQARQTSLAGQAQRLRKLVGISPVVIEPLRPETMLLKNRQMAILPLEEAAIASERSLVRAEIQRRIKNLKNLHSMKMSILAKLNIAREKQTIQRTLYDKNLTQKSSLIETERELTDAHLELIEVEGEIIETEATILESRRRLEDVIASRRQRQGDQLSSILVDLEELQEQIASISNRLQRGKFRSPIHGIIQELSADFIGQIIAPGDKLLELIPMNDDLVVEVRLPTTEIRHVLRGQKVRIAVDGIEPHRVGYLHGNVQYLSPSTFIDENGVPYYRALIALENNELGGVRLIPGMTVQAHIKTGQRTILEYLLKPVYRAWDTAFRER